jgi:hypothetical protein
LKRRTAKSAVLTVEMWEEVLSGEHSYCWQQGLNVQPYVETIIMTLMLT